MTVCLHLHDAGQPNWETRWLGIERPPHIGDMMVLDADDEDWWEVELVVHQHYATQYPVDIYAKRTDRQSAVDALVSGRSDSTSP